MIPFLITLLIITCFLLVIVVLMQRPKSEGLGAAFGSSMTDNLFGTQTTNVLSRLTVWLGGLFFLLTLLISIAYVKQSSGQTEVQKQLLNAKMPAKREATPAAAPTADSNVIPAPTAPVSSTPEEPAKK
ncbi:MAG: preprotein translocase subunit SecG [Chthoniobacterales bacterium]